jgi:hypothetical protein
MRNATAVARALFYSRYQFQLFLFNDLPVVFGGEGGIRTLGGLYLETDADVDKYLAKLKKQILTEINAGWKAIVQ